LAQDLAQLAHGLTLGTFVGGTFTGGTFGASSLSETGLEIAP